MKAVILAGGFGTRLCEETVLKPKPMVDIGGMPILWHIMKIYHHHGINDFIICLGYKGYMVKEYFNHYFLHMTDITFKVENNKMEVHHKHAENWNITLVDTGYDTMTGGRLKRIKEYLGNDEQFCFTYGDAVADIDIKELIKHHKKEKRLSTLTAVQPAGRFGIIDFSGNKVNSFLEKPRGDGAWINGGFFVLSRKIFDYIDNDSTVWEQEPMQDLAKESEMTCYFHNDFWQSMDTLRDRNMLENLWKKNKAPWKIW